MGFRWLRGVPCQNNVQPGPAPSAAAPACQLGQTLAQIKDLLQLIEFSSIETCWKFHRIVMTLEYPFKVLRYNNYMLSVVIFVFRVYRVYCFLDNIFYC